MDESKFNFGLNNLFSEIFFNAKKDEILVFEKSSKQAIVFNPKKTKKLEEAEYVF